MLGKKRKVAHENAKSETGDGNCKPVSGNIENLRHDEDCYIIDVKEKDYNPNLSVKKPQKMRVDVKVNDPVSGNCENLEDNDCYVIKDGKTDFDSPCKQTGKEVRKMNVSVEGDGHDFFRRNSYEVTVSEVASGDECYVVYDSELSRTFKNLRCNNGSGTSCICSSEEAKDKFIASIIPEAYADPQARQILAVHEESILKQDFDMEEEVLDFEPSILHHVHSVKRSSSGNEKLIALGVPLRSGKWSKREDTILLRNWNNILKKYQIDNPILILGKYRGNNSVLKKYIRAKKLFLQLGKDLNDRSLPSIYERARCIFDVWNYKGRLSEKDKEKLLKLHSRLGNQWGKIAVLMNRTTKLCSTIIRLHLTSLRKGAWTAKEDSLLIKSVKKHVGREKMMTKFRRYPWSKIAQDVCGRNELQCRKRWLTYLCWKPKLFDQPKWRKRDCALLIYFMYLYMVEEECFIDWDMLYEKFKTSVPSYVSLKRSWCRLKHKVPNFSSKDHESIVLYLYKKHLPKILECCKMSMSDLNHMKKSRS